MNWKETFIKLFEDHVVPMIPANWQYGDNLNIYLDNNPDGGITDWSIGTGPIGKNNADYTVLESGFFKSMKQFLFEKVPEIPQDQLKLHCASLKLSYNRVTKELSYRYYIEKSVRHCEAEGIL